MNAFLSSVIRGLEAERAAAADAVSSLGHTPRRAEDFAASPGSPQIVCRAGVREADLLVLILGERYGDVQQSGKSATHEEFEEAQQMHLPVLAFIRSGMNPEPAQRALIAEVQEWVGGEFHGRFATPDELRDAVARGVHEFEVSRAGGTADPAEIQSRGAAAVALLSHRAAAAPRLAVIVAGGPRRLVLRPHELEDPKLSAMLQREAMFGPAPVLEPSQATRQARIGPRLVLAQDVAEVSVDEDGTVVVVQPAYEPAERAALRAVVHEHVVTQLDSALAYTGLILEKIDPLHRLSDLVPLAALLGGGYGAWRSRAEQLANPTTMAMNMLGGDLLIVGGPDGRINRPALLARHEQLAEDLAILLRRVAIERR